jgi:hypothetical protein
MTIASLPKMPDSAGMLTIKLGGGAWRSRMRFGYRSVSLYSQLISKTMFKAVTNLLGD